MLSVINMITVYRKHMMRFYKGDKKFLAKFEPGPYIALTDALKYASYQVIFVISGYIFSTVLVATYVHVGGGLGYADFPARTLCPSPRQSYDMAVWRPS